MRSKRRAAVRALLCTSLLATPALAQQAGAPAQEPDSLIALARAQVGRRYLLGGNEPNQGFDCSGFTRYIMRAVDILLPRTADDQARIGREVPKDVAQLRVGDLLTFGTKKRITHIGVYIGDGKYVHASSKAGRVVEARFDPSQTHIARAWQGVRRVLAGDSASRVAPAVVAGSTPTIVTKSGS